MNDPSKFVGARLRELRLRQGLTFRALATRSGVSASMISDTERGTKSPSINVLIALAEALGTTLSDLLNPGEAPRSALVRVLRANQQSVVNENGVRREHFEPAVEGSNLEFLRFVLPPGADTGEMPAHAHGKLEHAHVSAGTVEVFAAGEQIVAKAGDTLIFRADQQHRYRNVGEAEASIYVVVEREAAG